MRVKARLTMGAIAVLAAATVAAAYAKGGDLRLIDAVRNENKSAVVALIHKVDVNTRQPDGATALHWAAYRNDLESATLLIKAGADVNAVNELEVTPLYLACQNANADMVEKLLAAGANANSTLPSGETALMSAAHAGSVGAVKALVAHHAEVNAREHGDQQTALMWAVNQKHPEVVRLLIDKGADVKARSATRQEQISRGGAGVNRGSPGQLNHPVAYPRGGYTPILFAARVGDVESARALLAAGADINDMSPDGATVLITATHSGQTKFAEFVIDEGADVNLSEVGYSALHLAIVRDDEALTRKLLEHSADPNAKVMQGTIVWRQAKAFSINGSLTGATPFLLASKYVNVPIMRVLLKGGADPNMTLPDGTTALMLAAGLRTGGFGRGGEDRKDRDMDTGEQEIALSQDEDKRAMLNSGIDAVRLLIDELHVDVNAANRAGDTALHGAASHGFSTVIKYLVDKGANLSAKNKAGRTPQGVAATPAQDDLEIRERAKQTVELLKKLAESHQ